jgi:hypothetical protein
MTILHMLAEATTELTSRYWATTFLLPIVTAVLGWFAGHFKVKEQIKLAVANEEGQLRLALADEQRKVRERDLEMDTLKKRREIEDVKTGEQLQHTHTLADLLAKMKQAGVTLPEMDQMKQFIVDGKVIEPAAREPKQDANEKIHIVSSADGSRRQIWTDLLTKNEVYQYVPRTMEEVSRMAADLHIWILVSEDRLNGSKIAKSAVDGREIEVVKLYQAETVERIKNFPNIETEADKRRAFAKMQALSWVLGFPFGWPLPGGEPDAKYFQT